METLGAVTEDLSDWKEEKQSLFGIECILFSHEWHCDRIIGIKSEMNSVKSSKWTSEALTTGCQTKGIGDQEAAKHIVHGETKFSSI